MTNARLQHLMLCLVSRLRRATTQGGTHAGIASEDGTQLIELALVTPVLLIILFAAVDCGRAYFVNMEVASAAEAGAMYGLVHPSDTAGMQAAASLDAQDLSNLSSTATYGSECSDGSSATSSNNNAPNCGVETVQYVEVDTTATYQPILVYPGLSSLFVMNGKSRMRATF